MFNKFNGRPALRSRQPNGPLHAISHKTGNHKTFIYATRDQHKKNNQVTTRDKTTTEKKDAKFANKYEYIPVQSQFVIEIEMNIAWQANLLKTI